MATGFTEPEYRQHQPWMQRALDLAKRGLFTADPNPRVGCVLTLNNHVIGEGWHAKAGEAHAEINALRDAANNGISTQGARAYVTLEPCSHHGKTGPCAQALIDAGIADVVIAMQDPNPLVAGRGIALLQAAGITVSHGLLQDQAEALNPGFIKRMLTGLPHVRVKLAASMDGRTALNNGQSQWITGTEARLDVQHYRARSSAIITGIGTVLADDPSLNVRLDNTTRQPLRVVLDHDCRTPADAKLLTLDGDCRVLHTNADIQKPYAKQLKDLAPLTVLKYLASLEMNEIWVEAGATLAGSFLSSGVTDELVLYQAPVLLGDKAQPLAVMPELQQLDQASRWKLHEVQAVGDDWRVTLQPQAKPLPQTTEKTVQ